MKTRKPIVAVTVQERLVVVCDDGSVWYIRDVGKDPGWTEHPPVPGTEAEAEDQN